MGAAVGGRVLVWWALCVAAAAALLAGAALPAAAAPQEPMMTQARLMELLDASPSGTVDGYFKTVAKGDAIVAVPCTIMGVVPQAAMDSGDLLLFQAGGPVIAEAGGIAAGMSGSPVYVNDGGDDMLVAAVSYGDWFTSNGLGLATPIEHMTELESEMEAGPLGSAARTIALPRALKVGGATVTHVCVAPTAHAAHLAEPNERTLVMRPLSLMMIGGLSSKAPAFSKIKSYMAQRGIEVRAGLENGAAGNSPLFETALVPGASVGSLYMRGDFYYGGMGTATYTTADNRLVAFGHPMEWDGRSQTYMTNAEVIGLWNSAETPYKVMAPGKVRGTFTLDGGAGIAGVMGDLPADIPFVCHVTNTDTGASKTFAAYATPYAADKNVTWYSYMKAVYFYTSLCRGAGEWWFDGNIDSTLTIDVSDGDEEYTITRQTMWEDLDYHEDAAWVLSQDLYRLFERLTADPDGTAGLHIKRVTLDATLASQLNHARIVDVSVPGGVRTGLNTVKVKLYQYGSTTPRIVDVPLTVPAGVATGGAISVMAPAAEDPYESWYSYNYDPPLSVADLVDELNSAPGNDDLVVVYDPSGGADVFEGPSSASDVVTAVADTDTFLTGWVSKSAASMRVAVAGSRVTGQPMLVSGVVEAAGSLDGQAVRIYAREAGETADTLVAETTITFEPWESGSPEGDNTFVAFLPAGLTHSGTVTAVWDGNAEHLESNATRKVAVKAKVGLAATRVTGRTIRATARLTPSDAGGKVRFVRVNSNGTTRTVKTVVVDANGKAACTYTGRAGLNRVRAIFLGSAMNAAATSPVRALRLP